jgi:hypothetical protein
MSLIKNDPGLICLSACGHKVSIHCTDAASSSLLSRVYGQMQVHCNESAASIRYEVGGNGNDGFHIRSNGQGDLRARDNGEFLFLIDGELVIALQRLRPDLLFLHAAVAEFRGRAIAVVASSGTGKSTAILALMHEGFRYLSDELAPIDLSTLRVHAYPRALCLKANPPSPYSIPADTLRTPERWYIPNELLPGASLTAPTPLAAIFLLARDSGTRPRRLRPLRPAEAAAKLFSNTLNALAHPGQGLDAVAGLVDRLECFEVNGEDLPAACTAIRSVVA